MISLNEIKGANCAIDEKTVRDKYEKLTRTLIADNITITTMESCTSGQIASLITDTEGSSAIMKGACITYSNEAKIMEGVPAELIEKYGVYSAETASAMAEVCRKKYNADIGIGVTGSFGNIDPNNADSVPGEVYFAIASVKTAYTTGANGTVTSADANRTVTSVDANRTVTSVDADQPNAEPVTCCFHCTIPPQNSRLAYKLYMADVIVDQLNSL